MSIEGVDSVDLIQNRDERDRLVLVFPFGLMRIVENFVSQGKDAVKRDTIAEIVYWQRLE
jgi:hypothetical protein